MEKFTVLFKKSDFKQADFFNPSDCPINRALRRCYPNAEIIVGGKTATVTDERGISRFDIGETRMNGSLIGPRGLSVQILSHIHNAIRYKHFKHAGVELTRL